MSRVVLPNVFMLRAASLPLTSANQQAFNDIRSRLFTNDDGNGAVALRWCSVPNLGFPREPFQVFRRSRNTLEFAALVTISTTALQATATMQEISLAACGDFAYFVRAQVTVASSGSITVQALGAMGQAIAGQSVTLTTSGTISFRCPGLTGLGVTGSGSVTTVQAIGESAYANLADWLAIQTVGLPLLNNEIGTSYSTKPQGIWPNPTTQPAQNGVEAAEERILIAAELQLAPPATGIADFPLPAWPLPNPDAYVTNMRGSENLIPMIEGCLEHSVDTNPAQMQVGIAETVNVDGINQLGAPASSPSQTSQVNFPVVNVAMLAVCTDSFAALGLGYGTTDIPPDPKNTDKPAITLIGVSPVSATVAVGKTQQFTATIPGTTNPAVIWSVNGIAGGNATIGTISTTGLYTAPAAAPSVAVFVAANSAQFLSRSALVPVTIGAGLLAPVPAAVATPVTTSTLPSLEGFSAYDYMVVAPYKFPLGTFDGSATQATLAALSTGQPPVVEPQGLTAAVQQTNAPLERNQATPAVVQVSWTASPVPQGYGILVSRASNQSAVLNATRPPAVGGYDVFIGLPPGASSTNPPAPQNPGFSDLGALLPTAPPNVTDRYLVAAQDVFGLWSGWVESSVSLAPVPPVKPAIINAQFNYSANSGSPPSSVVPATLQIAFGWNWEDRAPAQIRFVGAFVPAPAKTLGPPFPTGFALSNDGTAGAAVTFTFHYGSPQNSADVDPTTVIPTIDSGHHTTAQGVTILGTGSPPTPAPNSSLVQYSVEITGFELDFSSSTELDFVIYASGAEELQPTVWSDYTDQIDSGTSPPVTTYIGRIVKAFDPNPPVVIFNPPTLSWTALPDATGIARGILSWTVDPTAAGYFVWEATESALLNLMPPGTGTPEPPSDTPYVIRAQTLKNLIAQYPDFSLQAFARLTKDPIAAASTEIELPGSANTLYVYRISAIGQNNVESQRSADAAVFGVPQRSVPGTPRILLRNGPWSPPGIQVIVLPVQSAATPAAYRIFRVRSLALATNPSEMGPAKIEIDEGSPPELDIYSITTLAGNTLTGVSVIDTAAIPSWYPYYYRATALGGDDTANGVYRGESPYSSSQEGYSVPPAAPLARLLNVSVSAAKNTALVSLTTDLPAAAVSPLGPALVELLELVHQGTGPAKLETLASTAPNLLAQQVLTLPAAPPAHPVLARSAIAANGQWTLYVLTPYSAAAEGNFIVRLTDPLARQSSVSF